MNAVVEGTTCPPGFQTLRGRIDGVSNGHLWAEVTLVDYPDHPIRIGFEILDRWHIPHEPGTLFWLRGDIADWPDFALAMRRHPETALGVGEPPEARFRVRAYPEWRETMGR